MCFMPVNASIQMKLKYGSIYILSIFEFRSYIILWGYSIGTEIGQYVPYQFTNSDLNIIFMGSCKA